MLGLSDILHNELLDHVFSGGVYTKPTKYIALFSAEPNGTTTVNELSGNGYARIVAPDGSWSVSVAGQVSNTAEIQFAKATGAWAQATHFAIYDALTAGNCLGAGILTTPKTLANGDRLSFEVGALIVQLQRP